MVFVYTLLEDGTSSTRSSTKSIPTEVLHLKGDDYDLDFPPHPLGFPHFLVFLPQRGDLVLNVSNNEPVADGEIDDQRQHREQRNADQAQRRAYEEEEHQSWLHPQNLNNALDMVGNQQVFKTPSTNVAITMANLE